MGNIWRRRPRIGPSNCFCAADLSEVRTIPNQPDWAFGLEFSPDGKSLAAGLFNGVLEIYEVEHANVLAAK